MNTEINKIWNTPENYNYIKAIIHSIIPNLNNKELDILTNYNENLINFIAIKFNLNGDQYFNKLIENDNQDIISIFNMLLPNIENEDGLYTLHKKIYNIKDISIFDKSKKNVTKIQFSRSITNLYLDNNDEHFKKFSNNNFFKKKKIDETSDNDDYYYEYEYNLNDVDINFNLLLNTISRISNKLYIEWINIRPITFNNY
jgi:hypothetical protein